MNRKLAACILAFVLGTTVTVNANAVIAEAFDNPIKSILVKLCYNIPFDNILLKLARTVCL
ncbi:hypothetical protein [Xenorhabdus sp. IM139775]|uniref:hypothetical protein n=1 Tax=Xenorhabdus sp. IM139775 TaxID=3025876 RepID=UPI002358C204|nr:hypothetical protein [Xenorhabdus sp. IM139775]MDC9594089.1 hypothetical protein [Xenorhabdus sp. IM139775]